MLSSFYVVLNSCLIVKLQKAEVSKRQTSAENCFNSFF